MFKRAILIVGSLAALVLGYVVFVLSAPISWKYGPEIEMSERLIASVEVFRRVQGRLPSEREVYPLRQALGMAVDETCPCYAQQGSDRYIVWFGTSVGSSYVYDSSVSGWSEEG